MLDGEKIGQFLQELRKEKKLTQEELAEKLYIKRESISKWERGIQIPTVENIINLAEYFQITPNEILYGERKNKTNEKEIENTPVVIMSSAKKMYFKLFKLFMLIIISLTLTFLSIYFVNNYNSIKVYTVSGSGTNFDLSQGILLTSPDRRVLQLGNIISILDEEIQYIEIYYKDNKNKIDILTTDDLKQLSIDISDKEELMGKKINDLISNIYITIYTEKFSEEIKLNIKLDFTNNKIINEEKEQDKTIQNKSNNNKLLSKFKEENGRMIYKGKHYTYELFEQEEFIQVNTNKLIIRYFYKSNVFHESYKNKKLKDKEKILKNIKEDLEIE